MLSTRPLGWADRELIGRLLRAAPPELSEFTFTNLYVWRRKRPIQCLAAGENFYLLVKSPDPNGDKPVLFGPPLGPDPATAITKIAPHISGVERIPEALLATCREAGFQLTADRDNADYLYRTETLRTLSGRRFAKKRNHINHCLTGHDCSFELLEPSNIDQCLAMQEQWCAIRGCADEPGLEGEHIAIKETLANYRQLPLIGGAIRVDGRIAAFALAQQLNPTTAVWHFEKALPGISGLGQLITHWFAKYCLAGFPYTNREQDLGIPGLRQAKESYHPERLIMKYRSTQPSETTNRF